jgi:hypothetical protein
MADFMLSVDVRSASRMLLKDVIEIEEFRDFTFRSLLSHAMKKECPHLLHDDEHISSYKTSKGRNLTGILDRDVFSSLPQLMEKDELPKVEVVLVRPSAEIVTDETGREMRCAFDAIMPGGTQESKEAECGGNSSDQSITSL